MFFFAYMLVGVSNGVPLFSVSTFLVQIVQRLGFSTVITNLLTVAPNVVGAITLICFARSSDHFRNRAFHIIGGLAITMTGFIILAKINVVENKGVAYFACFLLCAGCSIPSPLLASWYNNNTPDESKRAMTTGDRGGRESEWVDFKQYLSSGGRPGLHFGAGDLSGVWWVCDCPG